MEAHAHKKVRPPKRERGQGLVETVFVLPFLLVLVVGIVEVGLALNRQLTVVNAAREGARFGAFGASASDIHTQTLLATSQMFEFTEDNAVVVVNCARTPIGRAHAERGFFRHVRGDDRRLVDGHVSKHRLAGDITPAPFRRRHSVQIQAGT